jgi:hypothetical protein
MSGRATSMFKHIVMWDLRGDTPEDKARARALLKRKFESLRGQIPGLLHLHQVDYAVG